jgi:hypothetical protein
LRLFDGRETRTPPQDSYQGGEFPNRQRTHRTCRGHNADQYEQ